jgi:hypothetical protein
METCAAGNVYKFHPLRLYSNHRQLLRYEKKGLESAFGAKKKHILKNN